MGRVSAQQPGPMVWTRDLSWGLRGLRRLHRQDPRVRGLQGEMPCSLWGGEGRGRGRGRPNGVSGGGTQCLGRMERERVEGGATRHRGSAVAGCRL